LFVTCRHITGLSLELGAFFNACMIHRLVLSGFRKTHSCENGQVQAPDLKQVKKQQMFKEKLQQAWRTIAQDLFKRLKESLAPLSQNI